MGTLDEVAGLAVRYRDEVLNRTLSCSSAVCLPKQYVKFTVPLASINDPIFYCVSSFAVFHLPLADAVVNLSSSLRSTPYYSLKFSG